MNAIKVLLPAKLIPAEARVTKRTGNKVYTLRDKLRIFGGTEKQTITAEDGVRFMVAGNGDASCVRGETELIWETDWSSLQGWAQDLDANRGTQTTGAQFVLRSKTSALIPEDTKNSQ